MIDLSGWEAIDARAALLPYAGGYAYSPDGFFRVAVDADGKATQIARRTDDGGYTLQQTGNAENTRYWAAGVLDPRLYVPAAAAQGSSTLIDDFLSALFSTAPAEAVEIVGRLNDRGTYSTGSGDPTAFESNNYWSAIVGGTFDRYYPAAKAISEELGLRTPQTVERASWWQGYMSPGAQSARDDPDDGFLGLGDFGNLLAVAGVALGGYFGLEALGAFGGAEAATATAVAGDVGAISIPGAYGSIASSTAALAPSISGLTPVVSGLSLGTGAALGYELAGNGAASWLTLKDAASAINTASKAVNTAGTVAKLSGITSTAPMSAAGLYSGLTGQSSKGLYMETPQGMPQSGATPQNVVMPSSGDSSVGPLLLLGLGVLLYLVKL